MATETVAFIDARCKKCGAHIGWHGRVVDMPDCRRCGAKPDRIALGHDQHEIDEFQQLLRELRSDDKKSWDKWRKARVAAGLTLRQAAKQLEIPAYHLSLIEQSTASPVPKFAAQMAACYGG